MRLKIVFLALFFVSLVFSLFVLFQDNFEDKTDRVGAEHSITEKEKITIVIDPGHGGFDGGAVAKDGTVEKEINLEIAMALKKIMRDYPIEIVMTRTTDEALSGDDNSIKNKKRQDLEKRREIIENSNADLTISIHLNSYPEDESVYGAQVFYPKNEQKRTSVDKLPVLSKEYAESVQKTLEINVDDGRERQAMSKNDILLFNEPNAPIILVECGFLSNKEELKRLKSPKYQELLAQSIWQGINVYLDLEKKEKIQIIQNTNKQ